MGHTVETSLLHYIPKEAKQKDVGFIYVGGSRMYSTVILDEIWCSLAAFSPLLRCQRLLQYLWSRCLKRLLRLCVTAITLGESLERDVVVVEEAVAGIVAAASVERDRLALPHAFWDLTC